MKKMICLCLLMVNYEIIISQEIILTTLFSANLYENISKQGSKIKVPSETKLKFLENLNNGFYVIEFNNQVLFIEDFSLKYDENYKQAKTFIGRIKSSNSKEYNEYVNTMQGNISDCDSFITAFPTSKYLVYIKNRKESLVDPSELTSYKLALNGSTQDCDAYLKKYPNGNFYQEVKDLKIFLINKPENDAFGLALNGSIEDCDNYIKKYPNGKHIIEIKKLRAFAEEEAFKLALNGGYRDCDNYINKFPKGKYSLQVIKLREEKYKETKSIIYITANEIANLIRNYVLEYYKKTDTSTSGLLISSQYPLKINLLHNSSERNIKIKGNNVSYPITGDVKIGESEKMSFILSTKDGSSMGSINNSVWVSSDNMVKLIENGELNCDGHYYLKSSIPLFFEQGILIFKDNENEGSFSDGSIFVSEQVKYISSKGIWIKK